MKHDRKIFWREWGPLMVCAVLSGAALYLLALSSAPLAGVVLAALALGCPLVAAVAWWLHGDKATAEHGLNLHRRGPSHRRPVRN